MNDQDIQQAEFALAQTGFHAQNQTAYLLAIVVDYEKRIRALEARVINLMHAQGE